MKSIIGTLKVTVKAMDDNNKVVHSATVSIGGIDMKDAEKVAEDVYQMVTSMWFESALYYSLTRSFTF